jgi:uncharacterized phage infection (PIP) family protein YhgE
VTNHARGVGEVSTYKMGDDSMVIFKKIIALIVTILAVLGVIAVIVAIVGSWILSSQITTTAVNLLTAVETATEAAGNGLDRIDQRLERAVEQVEGIEARVVEISDNVEENSLVLTLISKTVGEQLAPSVNQAKERVDAVRDTAQVINQATEAINAIPFVSVGQFLDRPDRLTQLSDNIADLQLEIQETRTAIAEGRSEIIEGGVSIITTRTSRLADRLERVREGTAELNGRITEFETRLAERKKSVRATMGLITIALTLVLLFTGLAFVSLAVHGWSFYVNPNRRALPTAPPPELGPSETKVIPLEEKQEQIDKTEASSTKEPEPSDSAVSPAAEELEPAASTTIDPLPDESDEDVV